MSSWGGDVSFVEYSNDWVIILGAGKVCASYALFQVVAEHDCSALAQSPLSLVG
jgi:hypothetical protein